MPQKTSITVGTKVNRLTLIEIIPVKGKETACVLQCDCGATKKVNRMSHFTLGDITSCGCPLGKPADISGVKLGSMTMVKPVHGVRKHGWDWVGTCECGATERVHKSKIHKFRTGIKPHLMCSSCTSKLRSIRTSEILTAYWKTKCLIGTRVNSRVITGRRRRATHVGVDKKGASWYWTCDCGHKGCSTHQVLKRSPACANCFPPKRPIDRLGWRIDETTGKRVLGNEAGKSYSLLARENGLNRGQAKYIKKYVMLGLDASKATDLAVVNTLHRAIETGDFK